MNTPAAIASAAVAITPAAVAPSEPLSVLELGQAPIVRHASASAARIASGQSAIEAFRRAFQGLSSPPTPRAASSPAPLATGEMTLVVAPSLLPNRHVPIPPAHRLAQNGQPRTPAPISLPPVPGGQTAECARLGSHSEGPADAALESGLAPLSQPAGALALPRNKGGGPSHALRSRWRFTLRAIGRAHRVSRPSSTSSMAPQAGTLRGLAPIPAESLVGSGAGLASEGRAIYDDFTDGAAGMPDLSSPRTSPTPPPSARRDCYDLSTSPVGGEQVVFGVSSDAVNAVASGGSTPPPAPPPSPADSQPVAVASTSGTLGDASIALIPPAVPMPAVAAVPTLPTPRSPSLRPPTHTPAGARLTGRSHRQLQASAAGDMGAPDDSPVQRRNTVAPGEPRTPARLTSPLGPSAGSGLRHRTPVATGLGSASASAGGVAMRSSSRHHLEEEKQAPPRMRYTDDESSSEGGESVVGEPPRTSIGDLTAYGAQHVSDDDGDCFDSVSQAGGGRGGKALSPHQPAASPLAQSTRKATALASPPGSFRRAGALASPAAGLASASAATLPLGSPAVLASVPSAAPPQHPPGTEDVQSPHARHLVPDGDGDGATLQAGDSLPAAPQWLPESLQPLAQAAIVASRRRVRPTPKYRQSHLDNVDDRGAYDFAIVVRAVFSAKQAAALARAKADADARAAAALVQARHLGWTSPMKTAVPAPAASAALSTASRRHRGVARKGTAARANDDDDESRDSASLSDSDNLSDSSDGSSSGPRKREPLPRRRSPPAGKARARRSSLTDEDDDYDHSSEDDDDSLARSPSRRRGRGRAGDSGFESALPSSDSGSGETSESSSGGDGDAVTHAARRGGGRGNSIGTFLAGLSPWGRLVAPTDAARARNGHTRSGGDEFRLSSSSSAAVGFEASLSDAGTGVAASSLRRVTFSNTEASHARAAMDVSESASSPPGSGAPAHVVVELPAVPAASTRSHKCSEILAALRGAGLQAKRVRSLSRRTWLIKLRASEARLEEEAEAMHLRLRRRDGGWSRFRRSARVAFLPVIAENGGESARRGGNEKLGERRPTIFHSSDRQLLINHILRSSSREGGCDLGEGSPLGAYVTHMMPLHMRARLDELRNDWLATWRPAISQGTHDRIGDIDPNWYAPPVLISIDTAAVAECPQAAAASAAVPPPEGGGVWLQRLRASLGVAPRSSLQQDDSSGAAPAPVQAVPPRDRCDVEPLPGNPPATAGGVDRRRRPPRDPRCCVSICSTISCAFCCGPVVLAWIVVSMASCSARCARSLSRCCGRLTTQPLDRIASYFGESIAFYFAWLEFYTNWLLFPAVIGALLFVGQLYWGEIDIAYAPLFSLFIALWAILLLEFWKRRNAELAQRWGVLHYEDEEIVSLHTPQCRRFRTLRFTCISSSHHRFDPNSKGNGSKMPARARLCGFTPLGNGVQSMPSPCHSFSAFLCVSLF